MDQRLLLAIALSIVVIFGYYAIFPPPPPPKRQPEEQAQQGEQQPQQQAGAPAATPAAPAQRAGRPLQPTAESRKERQIVVETPRYTARIDTRGGRLVSLKLKQYKKSKAFVNWEKPPLDLEETVEMVKHELPAAAPLGVEFVGKEQLTLDFRRLVFTADREAIFLQSEQDAPQHLTLTGSTEGGLTLRKVITFHPDSYIIDYEAQVINYGGTPTLLRVVNLFGEGPSHGPGEKNVRSFYGPMFREDDSVETETADDIEGKLVVRQPQWLGITSNYFLTVATPLSRISHAEFRAVNLSPNGDDENWVAYYGVELPAVQLAPDNMIASKARLYMGPKKNSELAKFGDSLEESLDLTLDILASPLLVMLRWFHGVTGNYGVAIILLTLVVRVLLFPLTYKGMVSMKRMSKLQPKMKALREKYKDNKERVNKEMMDMYRRYKVNPLGGCLPIALQIPIFFALYSALLGAIELRHSPFFGWISDLSSSDPLYVTPLLMGASMFLQQRLTPTAMDPTQQKILMWMPVIFTAFMFNFPSGLVLYWLTSNLLSILQQLIINRVQVPELVERKT
jgi:YidC/Oxa1 family membrane protein insertase